MTEEQKKRKGQALQARALRREGKTFKEIATTLGVTSPTAWSWCKGMRAKVGTEKKFPFFSVLEKIVTDENLTPKKKVESMLLINSLFGGER